MNLTKGQSDAYEILCTGSNVFITGEAGTGKSYIIQKYINDMRDAGKNVLVTAPTGTAADNIGGMTLHRAFNAPIGVIPPKEVKTRNEVIQCVDIVVIDEISMCRFDLFDYVARIIMYENEIRISERMQAEIGVDIEAKDDIQLIVMGDFYQLPPVITKDDEHVLAEMFPNKDYGRGYAFKASMWDAFCFDVINLTEIVRQEEKGFKTCLNNVRTGTDKYMCMNFLSSQSSDFPFMDDDAIFLSATNKDVNDINQRQLAKVNSEMHVFDSEITGDVRATEKFAEDTLYLKEGCKVMFTINDTEKRFVNGTIGIVKKIYDNSFLSEIVISIPGKDEVILTRHQKDIVRPVVTEKEKTVKEIDADGKVVSVKKTVKALEEQTVGTFTQFPLRLAYAITIHKSQGKTFEKVNLNPYCWDAGQFYTALSRCKTIGGICFTGPIKSKYIVPPKEVINYFKKIK